MFVFRLYLKIVLKESHSSLILKVILGGGYIEYKKALNKLDLKSIEVCFNFAYKGAKGSIERNFKITMLVLRD